MFFLLSKLCSLVTHDKKEESLLRAAVSGESALFCFFFFFPPLSFPLEDVYLKRYRSFHASISEEEIAEAEGETSICVCVSPRQLP